MKVISAKTLSALLVKFFIILFMLNGFVWLLLAPYQIIWFSISCKIIKKASLRSLWLSIFLYYFQNSLHTELFENSIKTLHCCRICNFLKHSFCTFQIWHKKSLTGRLKKIRRKAGQDLRSSCTYFTSRSQRLFISPDINSSPVADKRLCDRPPIQSI